MVRLVGALALIGSTGLSAKASAAILFFQAVETNATAICTAPCYQVQMFYEDSTRSLPLQGFQFDVDIFGSVTVPRLPVPPEANSNAAGANASSEDADGNAVTVPWNLTSMVGQSPNAGFNALMLEVADGLITVDSVQTVLDDSVACTPAAVCATQLSGLMQDRIYLGRFNVTWNGGPVAIRVGGLFGVGPGFEDPVEGIGRLDGAEFSVEGFPTFDPADSDRDGVVDEQDNCPSIQNPGQEDLDLDALGDPCDPCDFSAPVEVDTDGNGIEDGCECGDQNGDGRVDMFDLIAINLAIFNPGQVSPLCDTNNDGLCNVQDIVGANRKILGRPAYCS